MMNVVNQVVSMGAGEPITEEQWKNQTVGEALRFAEDALHRQLGEIEALRCKLPESVLKMKRGDVGPLLRWI